MKARKYNFGNLLTQAQRGEIDKKDLKKIIKAAQDFGFSSIAEQFQLYVYQPADIAPDHAPAEVLERVAQGISYLNVQRIPLTRTKQMLKRHGVIETIHRITSDAKPSKNLEILANSRHLHLSAEAIVLDFPELFSEKVAALAKMKLAKLGGLPDQVHPILLLAA
ncbi:hypothetical protein ICN30_07890 [Polynucleobacter sp. 31A-FELB]|jgi:hypothetical protein|uniref:hypothetical protein n=1 Tax=Polynucleobacter sp. 31A-FELB TaxID=2689096 RepID=UPI001C0E1F3F|nr:hypothetical protein [Polynucleobacter sp. 31A-FELB]MBU3587752.1 hypothetical protein [Polynucleobacter sp. 31A-FELB]